MASALWLVEQVVHAAAASESGATEMMIKVNSSLS